MNCQDIPALIPASVDGELDAAQAEALEAHLRGCPECTRLIEAERGWRRTVQTGATRYTAPDRLRARLAVALAEADAATPAAPTGQPRAAASLAERGYNVVHWTASGMSFWAVSDVAVAELREFARLYQNRNATPAS